MKPSMSMASGVLYSFLLRILSFALSQLTIRFVDPTTLGKASIRLELICSTTVLFLGREGFRVGLMRFASGNGNGNKNENENYVKDLKAKRVNNVAWLSVPVSIVFTLLALSFHLHTYRDQVSSEDQDELDDYKLAGILYCIASAIEITSEPCMINCLRTMDVKARAKAEAFASIGKAFCCVFLLTFGERKYNAASFGLAQCVYASIVSAVLYKEKLQSIEWPSFKLNFDFGVLKLCVMFCLQSIFKHLLTDGDRIVLSAIVGAYDSGVYAMASAYGGMASRLIFQPLEENGRMLFSNKHAHVMRAKEEKKENAYKLVESLENTYCILIKFVLYIGLVFATFGSNYTAVLLRVLAGEQWGSNVQAVEALSAFCIYTALMSLNGMTEAFVYGVAESGFEVGSLAIAHGLVGFVFYVAAPLLVTHGGGTVGLIIANGLCMVLRSAYSLHFALSYFENDKNRGTSYTRSKFFQKLFPKPSILAVFVSVYIVMRYSRDYFLGEVQMALLSIETASHIGIGLGCLVIVAVFVIAFERDFGRSLQVMVSMKPTSTSTSTRTKSE
jgi:oligosaccharide translocation protein RFT1